MFWFLVEFSFKKYSKAIAWSYQNNGSAFDINKNELTEPIKFSSEMISMLLEVAANFDRYKLITNRFQFMNKLPFWIKFAFCFIYYFYYYKCVYTYT